MIATGMPEVAVLSGVLGWIAGEASQQATALW